MDTVGPPLRKQVVEDVSALHTESGMDDRQYSHRKRFDQKASLYWHAFMINGEYGADKPAAWAL
ncbi:hypothetical protein N7523_010589 [Penicillium sp. IBT 18751x]|nr:hypothetical protein N7523_010589 [Penicillium sp. IBT 18751x]